MSYAVAVVAHLDFEALTPLADIVLRFGGPYCDELCFCFALKVRREYAVCDECWHVAASTPTMLAVRRLVRWRTGASDTQGHKGKSGRHGKTRRRGKSQRTPVGWSANWTKHGYGWFAKPFP